MTDAFRDQHGRFVLLTVSLELTPSDVESWPSETRVLMDWALERDLARDASFSIIDASGVAPYRLVEVYQDRYWIWATSDIRRETDSLDCVETYGMRQEQVPVASGHRIPTSELVRRAHNLLGLDESHGATREARSFVENWPRADPRSPTPLQVAAYVATLMMLPRYEEWIARARAERNT